MRRSLRLTLALLGISLFVVSNMSSPTYVGASAQRMVTGIDILIFKGNNSIHSDLDGFTANYTDAGNNVTVVSGYDFTTADLPDWDAIIIDSKMNMTDANVTAIGAWFAAEADVLLWVTGDDDYKSYHDVQFSPDNKILKEVGSQLRIDGGGINDAVSNDDGETYRVMANSTGVSSTLTDYVTTGFEVMKFHGPSAIMYTPDADANYKDLRNATLTGGLAGVNIVVNSSMHAYPQDQDTSFAAYDFYFSSNITGNYPLLAAETGVGASGSLLVVSGEAIYSTYKNMYGNAYENEPKSHQGSMIVDNLLAFHFTEVDSVRSAQESFVNLVRVTDTVTLPEVTTTTQSNFTETETVTEDAVTVTAAAVTETETKTEDAPVSTLFIGLALSTIAVFTAIRRRR